MFRDGREAINRLQTSNVPPPSRHCGTGIFLRDTVKCGYFIKNGTRYVVKIRLDRQDTQD